MLVDRANGLHDAGTGLRLPRAAKSCAGRAPPRPFDVKSVIVASLALAILSTTAPSNALAQSITLFQYVPGGSAQTFGSATGISADGSTVAGYNASFVNSSYVYEAFRWTAPTGVVNLGFASGFADSNFATAVNSNGTAVAGYGNSNTALQGFEWTAAGGMAGLGFAPGDTNNAAGGVNSDGSVVVGVRESDASNFAQAFRWTAAAGMVALGTLPGDSTSVANAVNADGSVVVGESDGSGSLVTQAFRWTAATGMVGLGALPGGLASTALGVSADGSTVVGSNEVPGSLQAFRWTAAGGMVGLGVVVQDLTRDVDSIARAANADGSVVVGTSYGPNGSFDTAGSVAFRWTAAAGIQNIEALLRNAGVINGSIALVSANAVSADGTIIAGDAENFGTGFVNAYIAVLPLPASLLAAPNSGRSPLAVTFRASGLNPALTYTINFGDGTTGALTRGSCFGFGLRPSASPQPPIGGGHGGIQCSGSASHTYTSTAFVSYLATLLNASGNPNFPLGTALIDVGGHVAKPLDPGAACCRGSKIPLR
jgi:probable HAF family extracellular repeat protein